MTGVDQSTNGLTSPSVTMPPYGYFGPPGTFSHQALLTLPELAAEPIPYATVGQALQAVRNGEIAAALVPIENSVEGGVSATLDNLTYGDPLVITREVLLPVQFSLFARPGTRLGGRAGSRLASRLGTGLESGLATRLGT